MRGTGGEVLILVGGAAAAGLCVYLLCWPLRRLLLAAGLVDVPNARSSHTELTPRGGGIAIVGALGASLLVLAVGQHWPACGLLIGTILVAAISLLDDWRAQPASVRLAVHLGAAGLAVFSLGSEEVARAIRRATFEGLPDLAGVLLAILWIAGYVNAFNFMDGIDGLAASQAAVTAFGVAILVGLGSGRWAAPPLVVAAVIAGAALGFLPHNFPRARMFMGDVGSASLGYVQAGVVLWAAEATDVPLVPLLLLHTNFVLDTSITLVRRWARGERVGGAHRDHFYQRLVRAGCSHASITLGQVGLQASVLVLLAFGSEWAIGTWAPTLVITAWCAYFAWAERRFTRSPRSA